MRCSLSVEGGTSANLLTCGRPRGSDVPRPGGSSRGRGLAQSPADPLGPSALRRSLPPCDPCRGSLSCASFATARLLGPVLPEPRGLGRGAHAGARRVWTSPARGAGAQARGPARGGEGPWCPSEARGAGILRRQGWLGPAPVGGPARRGS